MRKIKKLCEVLFGFMIIGIGVCDVVIGVPQTLKSTEEFIDILHDNPSKKPPVLEANKEQIIFTQKQKEEANGSEGTAE